MMLDFTVQVSILLHNEIILDMFGLAISTHLVMCLCFCTLWLYLLYSGQIFEENKSRLRVTVLTLNPLSSCIQFCIVNKMLLFCRSELVDIHGKLRRFVVNFSFCIGSS